MKITDAMVTRGAKVLFEESQEVDQDNGEWRDLPKEWRDEWKRTMREALTAALGPVVSPVRGE